ncbi:MAG: ABC transporter ATP-binding protein [Sumerlaeia bacterium]
MSWRPPFPVNGAMTNAMPSPSSNPQPASGSGQPLLELRGVVSGYGPFEILKELTFTVREGEILTLIGANGAGKSTTLNTICGIVPVRRGEIRFRGERIDRLAPQSIVGRGISQSPEGRRLFSELTVEENLDLGAYLRKDRDGIRRDRAHVYELFPRLGERKTQRAGSLSGGEQQMCAIGRALMARPKLLLMDEPSLGLAPIIVKQIFDIVREINRDGTSILLVEQNAHLALGCAHHGHVLSLGEIALSGTGRELLGNPDVKRMYLGEI